MGFQFFRGFRGMSGRSCPGEQQDCSEGRTLFLTGIRVVEAMRSVPERSVPWASFPQRGQLRLAGVRGAQLRLAGVRGSSRGGSRSWDDQPRPIRSQARWSGVRRLPKPPIYYRDKSFIHSSSKSTVQGRSLG